MLVGTLSFFFWPVRSLAGDPFSALQLIKPSRPALAKDFTVPGLDSRRLRLSDFKDKVRLLNFWATWCPPCRGTLAWLGDLKKKYGDRVAVLALAIESQPDAVRKVAAEKELPIAWAMGSPEIARAFGDVSAVPTLFVFDRDGKTAQVFYGAPPDLHARAEERLASLVSPGA